MINGSISFWYQETGIPPLRPPLRETLDADVCIVGGGFTGLWTAYYLASARPDLRIVVLEKRFAGFGASGRNGGWVTGSVPGLRSRYAADRGRDAVVAMQRAMNQTVDEVISVSGAEGIDADVAKGGVLHVARSPAQLRRLRDQLAVEAQWGNTDVVELSAEEVAARIRVDEALGGSYSPHCATVQPAKLAQGLARAVEGKGVTVYEDTPVLELRPHRAVTPRADVKARWVLRATEGFTASLAGLRRLWLPMNSSIIATEPLSEAEWAQIGWEGREALGDMAHAYMYAQRTAGGRIALGGRGVPYRYGSRTDADGSTPQRTVGSLREILAAMFPSLRGARIDHTWSGVLGVPRDWCATVGLDRVTGLGWAGGYVGTGVAATNLAGRTLRDLVLGEDSELVRLPWVDRQVRRWEPEPLRWLGVHAMYAAYRYADARESRTAGPTSGVATVADLVSGRR